MFGLNKNVNSAKTLVATLVLMGSFSVYSQQGAVEQTNESVLNSAPIDINGYVKEKPKATDSELEYLKQEITKQQNELEINKEKEKGYKELQKTTEKLVDATEDYLVEKRESQGTIDAYNDKIKCLMDENRDPKECDDLDKAQDSVKVAQAAPVVKTEVSKASENTNTPIRVIPFTGVTTYSAQGFVNLDTNTNMGVRAESDVTDRITVGVGIETQNVKRIGIAANVLGPINNYNYGGLGMPNAQLGAFDSIAYKSTSLEIFGKYNLVNRERFKVYAGAGLAYNRSEQTLNRQQFGFFVQPQYIGDTNTLDSNFVSGKLLAGTHVNFGGNWGANLDVSYSRGLKNNTNKNYFVGPQQRLLQEFARSIQKADAVSLQAGVSYKF